LGRDGAVQRYSGSWKGWAAGVALLACLAGAHADAAGKAAAPAGGAVGALGRLEPESGLIALGAAPGQTLLTLTVKDGDSVKHGQLLGTLSSYPAAVAARNEAAAQLEEARARLKAQTALGQAQIAQAAAGASRRVAEAGAELARAAIPVNSLSKALAVAEARVTAATLVAPIDGTVLDIGVHPGEAVGSRPVLTIGDVSRMRVVAEIYETDIGRVRLGQSATIRSRVFAKPLTGHVAAIGHMVFKNSVLNTDPTARADVRIVEVWIDLDQAPPALAGLSNLTVDVVIAGTPAAALAAAQASK
jgi:HlyD family secretion protein